MAGQQTLPAKGSLLDQARKEAARQEKHKASGNDCRLSGLPLLQWYIHMMFYLTTFSLATEILVPI